MVDTFQAHNFAPSSSVPYVQLKKKSMLDKKLYAARALSEDRLC
jgi:hypothetical protein